MTQSQSHLSKLLGTLTSNGSPDLWGRLSIPGNCTTKRASLFHWLLFPLSRLYIYSYIISRYICYVITEPLCLCALVVSTDSLVSGAITMTAQNYCSTVTTNFPKQESLYQTEDGQNCTKLDKTCLAELRLSHCPYVTLTDLSRRNCWSLEVSWHLLPVWPPL